MGSTLANPTTFTQVKITDDQAHGDGSLTVEGALTVAGALSSGNIKTGTTGSIADDAAASFTLPAVEGLLLVHSADGEGDTFGIYTYDSATPKIEVGIDGSGLTPTTGILAGTTGSDATVSVSVHTTGVAYIENRSGAALTFKYVAIG